MSTSLKQEKYSVVRTVSSYELFHNAGTSVMI